MAENIQALWIGDCLSVMEQMCIQSFLSHGHPFHLYAYQDIAGVPPGTVVLDANAVLPASRIFTYREHKTYAGFANFFRYKLLLEKGGWFVDADTICVQPFDFSGEYVFSSEGINGRQLVNVGAVKAPPGSPVIQYAWEACERFDVTELKWSQCGPALLRQAIEACALQEHVQHWEVFCPVHFSVWEQMLDPAVQWSFDKKTRAIHLWNELWRREGRNKDAAYPEACLYEQLKRRYLS
ncbi:glycosyltransferase [Acidicapsa acidisoli]|uniref:glycosyltransferase n=1 Tax=Acidicapsa acidisoli TaxID=1615681 RepID=UPI0021E02EBD|nr:glycosyltransferase [Acidicapsa acidisoli]